MFAELLNECTSQSEQNSGALFANSKTLDCGKRLKCLSSRIPLNALIDIFTLVPNKPVFEINRWPILFVLAIPLKLHSFCSDLTTR
jgi:hypothetical protein